MLVDKPASYNRLFEKKDKSKKTVKFIEQKEILPLLNEARSIFLEAKKKKQEAELFVDAEPIADPYEDCVKRVNILITELINKFGTNHPAVDVLIDASRDLEEIKNSDSEEAPETSEDDSDED